MNLTLAPLPADSQNLYAIRSWYLLAKFQAKIRKNPNTQTAFSSLEFWIFNNYVLVPIDGRVAILC